MRKAQNYDVSVYLPNKQLCVAGTQTERIQISKPETKANKEHQEQSGHWRVLTREGNVCNNNNNKNVVAFKLVNTHS